MNKRKQVSLRSSTAAVKKDPTCNLTDDQARCCELASDLIMNGGHEDDVNNLLVALIAHDWRRRFPSHPSDPKQRQQTAMEFAEKFSTNWYRALARHWPEPSNAPTEPHQEQRSGTETMARANLRATLEDAFREFQRSADPWDLWLLKEILTAHDGDLARSITQEMAASFTYVRVPLEFADRVRSIANLVINGKESAA